MASSKRRGRGRARAEVAVGLGAQAHRRLVDLYEISKLLTVFDDEGTFHAVLSVMAHTLPLRTAVLLLGGSGTVRTIAWKAKGLGPSGLRPAFSHARKEYRYLVSGTGAIRVSTTSVHDMAVGRGDRAAEGDEHHPSKRFVMLPLVAGLRPIFGAVQIEGAARLDESDLAFMNAVVNQLAVAIDRYATIERAQATQQSKRRSAEVKAASAERAADVQHFLASLSAALASSPLYRSALATCARLAVPHFADWCVIDELGSDGQLVPIESVYADETTRKLSNSASIRAPGGILGAQQAKALATGAAVWVREVDSAAAPELAAHGLSGERRRPGVQSMITVPLVSRERPLGVLFFATAGSGRRYEAADVAVAIEVAGRTAMAMENARLHEQTERAVRQRQDVLAMVSHDLRNPLSTILLVTQLLLDSSDEGDLIGARKKIEMIKRSAGRMNRMIADLLDLSSIDAGHFSIDLGTAAFGPLVAEALELLRPAAQAKSMHVEAHLPLDDAPLVCDRARVLQVLLNVVGNAIKFTSPGGSIRLTAERRASDLLVRVTDTGMGIPAERLDHVFERYWQARETASKGTGLGLYISKGIVEAHGGSIGVESVVGDGSTFFFTLPFIPLRRPDEATT